MIFVGIDPSINSSGVWVQENGNTHSYIVKGEKLTKREKIAQENILDFEYKIYDKVLLTDVEDTHTKETLKTFNFMNIVLTIKSVIEELSKRDDITVVMEGISYGSTMRTLSVFDLSGLNYLLRNMLFSFKQVHLYVCPPSEIKKFASGVGNAKKDLMTSLFIKVNPKYEVVPKVDDISDAYFMCEYAKKLYTNDSKSILH